MARHQSIHHGHNNNSFVSFGGGGMLSLFRNKNIFRRFFIISCIILFALITLMMVTIHKLTISNNHSGAELGNDNTAAITKTATPPKAATKPIDAARVDNNDDKREYPHLNMGKPAIPPERNKDQTNNINEADSDTSSNTSGVNHSKEIPINSTNKTVSEEERLPECFDLLIGIPTLPRAGNVDYLRQTLVRLKQQLKQMPAPTIPEEFYFDTPINTLTKSDAPAAVGCFNRDFWRVGVFVQKVGPEPHPVFDAVRAEFENQDAKEKSWFQFIFDDNGQNRFMDPFPEEPEPNHRNNPHNRPGAKGRQQNCDVISLLEKVDKSFKYRFFMFMEDDFLVCPDGLANLKKVVDKLHPLSDEELPISKLPFVMVSVSYGLNGLLIHREDVIPFANFVRDRIKLLPVDLLFNEYIIAPSSGQYHHRPLRSYVLPRVQIEHIGHVSTFEERNEKGFRRGFPRCGHKNWFRPDNKIFFYAPDV